MAGVWRDWYGEQLLPAQFLQRMEEVGRKVYGPWWSLQHASAEQIAEIKRLVQYETEDEFMLPL